MGFALNNPRLALLLASGRVSYEEMLRTLVKNDIELLRRRAREALSADNFLELPDEELAQSLRRVAPAKAVWSWRLLNNWHSFLYMAVRAYSPALVIETGVLYGHSSAAILAALEDNRKGQLISIDLPSEAHQNVIVGRQHIQVGLSSNILSVGCAIPVHLRSRWNLRLGDSLKLLPNLLEETGPISIFIHDSLHTYDHMMAEYRIGYDALEKSGLLISDDVGYNSAWPDFCKSKKENLRYLSKSSRDEDKFGFLIKSSSN
jgi:hypothetical protein